MHQSPTLDMRMTVPPNPISPSNTGSLIHQRMAPDAHQQPRWHDLPAARRIRAELAGLPSIVARAEIDTLHALLVEVAAGRAYLIQAGDCAEDPSECTADWVQRKAQFLNILAEALGGRHSPVIRVGRIAGQFAKPRSQSTEHVGQQQILSFRGHLINSPDPTPDARRHDPRRMLQCYHAARNAANTLRKMSDDVTLPVFHRIWTSHEALVLDYELPQVRPDARGRLILTSTHLPWIGDRTRQFNGAHVRLFSAIANPIACKIGPSATPAELTTLCARLDPHRTPGRLTLVARLGAGNVARQLPALVRAVRAPGHPAIWLCDPMHANTVTGPSGRKTRLLTTLCHEITRFLEAVTAERGVAGGLHLETTPHPVTECVHDEGRLEQLRYAHYTTTCDPRLNLDQALLMARAWTVHLPRAP